MISIMVTAKTPRANRALLKLSKEKLNLAQKILLNRFFRSELRGNVFTIVTSKSLQKLLKVAPMLELQYRADMVNNIRQAFKDEKIPEGEYDVLVS
jgi:hypothetical protein